MDTLGIRIRGENIVIRPGTTLELEQENPYLQFSDAVVGDFSLPIDIPIDDAGVNQRLTNYAGLLQQRVNGIGIECQLWDGGEQHSVGKLRVEKPTIDLNKPGSGSISCFYQSGVASFYNDIRAFKMRDIDVGGTRSFEMTNLSRSGSDGFWQHIHEVIDAPVNSYDYAFFPVINRGWTSGFATEIMNAMEYTGGTINFKLRATLGDLPRTLNLIVPFPYLHYVLQQAVAHAGWTIAGDILDDPDFLKITMLSFRAIDWRKSLGAGKMVSFDLADGLPDIGVGTFLIWLKNRFGWAYEPDKKNKILTIRPISTIGQVVKDFTEYVDPRIPKPISQEKKGFQLKNDWTGAESLETVNLEGLDDQGVIDDRSDLPAAAVAYENWVYLVAAENNYYCCLQDGDTGVWTWELLAANVYDHKDEGDVVEISTGATAIGSDVADAYMDFIPHIDMDGHWPGPSSAATNPNWSEEKNDQWGAYLVFYYGVLNNRSGDPIPFASHHIYDANGNQVADWSLAFSARTRIGHDEVGLVTEWNKISKIFRSTEALEITLRLPKDVYRQFNFSDGILIAGVRMYVARIRSTVPYSGAIICECVRI
jgi:hypothetical protein